MSDSFWLLFKVFMAFFAISNPLTNVPIFLNLTERFDFPSQRIILKRALWVAMGIVLVFTLGGNYIFEVFGITLPAFRITGGILVLFIGFEMVQSKKSKVSRNDPKRPPLDVNEGIANLAVSPLATPLMAGPGTIVTAMTLSAGAKWYEVLMIVAMYAVLCLVTWVMFINGRRIQKVVGEDLSKVISKLMGLILGVIGTDMILAGIKAAFNLG